MRRNDRRNFASIEPEHCSDDVPCVRCAEDQRFLRSKKRPAENGSGVTIFAGDLFAGCGGMTIGLTEAARRLGHNLKVSLAVDFDDDILRIYRRNLPTAVTRQADVAKLFDGLIGSPISPNEKSVTACTPVDILLGGPPCQGHSDLNNHTRRNDPKNALYLRMGRAAEVLKPKVVVIENVAAVKWDEARVAETTINVLRVLGYRVAAEVLDLRIAGVPQLRRRFVVLASNVETIKPEAVFEHLRSSWQAHKARTVKWAIHDLLEAEAKTPFDSASGRSPENIKRMAFLFKHGLYDLPNSQRPECHRDGNHTYRSVYGRLRWTQPAQTITTGFGSMGQGRYVHPQRHRTLTPHEAARLQTFPDWFDFGQDTPRGVLAKAIGNAVPPFLTLQIGKLVLPALAAYKAAETKLTTKPLLRPAPSSSAAAKRMRATRQSDTAPELALRKHLHALGLRYRTNQALLPGLRRRADIVFNSARVAVFVDGCFWHCCPRHASFPKANGSWWAEKLKANRERDRNTDRLLRDAGWVVQRIWEHEDPVKAAHRVLKCLEQVRRC